MSHDDSINQELGSIDLDKWHTMREQHENGSIEHYSTNEKLYK